MIVTLLTDYGRDDDFVGVCHGVIRRIDPDLQILDITHGIRRYRCARVRWCSATHCRTCPRACTSPSSTPRWAPSAARSHCAPATADCWWVPTTVC